MSIRKPDVKDVAEDYSQRVLQKARVQRSVRFK